MDTNEITMYDHDDVQAAGQTFYAEDLGQSETGAIMGCNDCIMHNIGDMNMGSLGRVVNVRFLLRNICPGRRVAVGLILYELGLSGLPIVRGFKVVTVPAHNFNRCRDISVGNVLFLLPDDDGIGSCCSRHFFVRHTHHYIDFPGGCFNDLGPITGTGCAE